jgi:hypothetical protein
LSVMFVPFVSPVARIRDAVSRIIYRAIPPVNSELRALYQK